MQLKLAADLGGAVSALAQLKQAVTSITVPVAQLKDAFATAGAAIERNSAAAAAAFKADLQSMVAEHALSLRQALALDAAYSAERSALDRADLERALGNDAQGLEQKASSYQELVALSQRYAAQSAEDQSRI